MRVRHLLIERKQLQKDTGWREDDILPRYFPVMKNPVPSRSGWKWRSAKVQGEKHQFVLLAKCRPSCNNWQAILILKVDDKAYSPIASYQYHDTHPGLHVHSDCEAGGILTGGPGIGRMQDKKNRRPGGPCRREKAWRENAWSTPEGFWRIARHFFRIQQRQEGLEL